MPKTPGIDPGAFRKEQNGIIAKMNQFLLPRFCNYYIKLFYFWNRRSHQTYTQNHFTYTMPQNPKFPESSSIQGISEIKGGMTESYLYRGHIILQAFV